MFEHVLLIYSKFVTVVYSTTLSHHLFLDKHKEYKGYHIISISLCITIIVVF